MPDVAQNDPPIQSLSGDFARIQTRVAPQNPYDYVKRETDPAINHSMDFIKRPINIEKTHTHADYAGPKSAKVTSKSDTEKNWALASHFIYLAKCSFLIENVFSFQTLSSLNRQWFLHFVYIHVFFFRNDSI